MLIAGGDLVKCGRPGFRDRPAGAGHGDPTYCLPLFATSTGRSVASCDPARAGGARPAREPVVQTRPTRFGHPRKPAAGGGGCVRGRVLVLTQERLPTPAGAVHGGLLAALHPGIEAGTVADVWPPELGSAALDGVRLHQVVAAGPDLAMTS